MKMEGGRNDEISEGGRNENDKGTVFWDLYEAAAKGYWVKAEKIYNVSPDYVRVKLTDVEDTALHVAVVATRNDFVENLVSSEYMQPGDLEITNTEGNTAFIIAAMLGNMVVVLRMLEKNKKLVNIRNGRGRLPVQMAASLGHEEMVKFLYFPTIEMAHFNEDDRILLLLTLIDNDIYDVALWMVREFQTLAVLRENKTDTNGQKTNEIGKAEANAQKTNEIGKTDANGKKTKEIGETALHALARKPLKTFNNEIGNSKQGILERFYYRFINSKKVEKEKMDPKALELVPLLWENIVKQKDYKQISELITKPLTIVSDAAKQGNIDFLSFLIDKHPNVIFNVDENNGYTFFHTAVEYRQEKIFKLIYKKSSIKNVIVALKVGKEDNTILHLAAKLPPDQNRLKVVSGAALQMQRELRWFKEVEKLMPPSIAGAKNGKDGQGETAHALFTESHKDLMKQGEEWMKTTANSCMIVATLIATIVFAAAFTVPGGVKDDTGDPHFLRKASFICFAIFDIISLVSSSCSIVIFLSILTARYAEEDFLRSLPRKLLWGLLTLCISIVAMMAVFCTTLYIVFDEGTKVPALLAIALAFILVIIFILLQIRLILDVFFSLMSSWKA